MDVLRTWVITLISVTVICTIVEKFSPQGSLSKYVRLVCGLVVTIVIAMPVLSFFKGDLKLDKMVWNEYAKLSEIELKNRIQKLQKEDSKQMLDVYKEALIADVKTRLRGEADFMVADVDVVIFEDEKKAEFGMIRALYLKVRAGSESKTGTLSNAIVDRIKSELSQVFSIEKDKVIIDSQN